MTLFKREEFYHLLAQVQPGTTSTDNGAQSSCFVFMNGRIHTFNGEIYCRAKSGLPKDLTAAVAAKPLLKYLSLLTDDEITIELKKDKLVIKASGKTTKMNTQSEITLPIGVVSLPDEWEELEKSFVEGINIVQGCASTNDKSGPFQHIHITQGWVEAGDDMQYARFWVKSPINNSLISKEAAKALSAVDAKWVGDKDSWLSFRTELGSTISILKKEGRYADFSEHLEGVGDKIIFPKGLQKEIAAIRTFSEENKDSETVTVGLFAENGGVVKIKGQATYGEGTAVGNIGYAAEDRYFRIHPKIFQNVIERSNECMICSHNGDGQKLKIEGSGYCYITELLSVE